MPNVKLSIVSNIREYCNFGPTDTLQDGQVEEDILENGDEINQMIVSALDRYHKQVLVGPQMFSNIEYITVTPELATGKYFVGPRVMKVLNKGFILRDRELIENRDYYATNSKYAVKLGDLTTRGFHYLGGGDQVTIRAKVYLDYDEITEAHQRYLAAKVANELYLRNSDDPKLPMLQMMEQDAWYDFQDEELTYKNMDTITTRLRRLY